MPVCAREAESRGTPAKAAAAVLSSLGSCPRAWGGGLRQSYGCGVLRAQPEPV